MPVSSLTPQKCNTTFFKQRRFTRRRPCSPYAYPFRNLIFFLQQWEALQGFIGFSTTYFVHLVSNFQCDLGVSGAIGEVGVAAGKSFAALAFTRRKNESLLACDIFSLGIEHDNVPDANLPMFLHTLETLQIPADDVTILKQSSLELTDLDFTSLIGGKKLRKQEVGYRLFHVDGGHYAEAAFHDINVAACALVPGGIILVDDLHNLRWPGVQEGFHRYMLSNKTVRKLEPFLYTGRLFLTTLGYANVYRRALVKAHPRLKVLDMYGVEVLAAHRINPTKDDFIRMVSGIRPHVAGRKMK